MTDGAGAHRDRARTVLLVAVHLAALTTTATAGVGLFLEPDASRRVWGTLALLVVLAALALTLQRGLTPVHGARPWSAAALVGDVVAASGWVYAMLTGGAGTMLLLVGLLPLYLWTLIEQARAGRDAAVALAAAEERLRFAADVHDLLGHHLTVIALQSELAARTTTVDATAAAAHAERARSMAATALVEMRRVVHGYREVDLAAQVTAVAEVLRASGVRAVAETGDVAAVPAAAGAALAATVREAGTNVLRHSRARWCTITVVRTEDRTELTIVNDGTSGHRPGDRHSSGLRGIADRLTEVGGVLEVDRADSTFTLRAAVPDR